MSNWDCKSGITDPYSQNNSSNAYQDIKLVLKTGPTQSIVSKAEAKNYLKMSSDTTDDDFVEGLISATTAVIGDAVGGAIDITGNLTPASITNLSLWPGI